MNDIPFRVRCQHIQKAPKYTGGRNLVDRIRCSLSISRNQTDLMVDPVLKQCVPDDDMVQIVEIREPSTIIIIQ